MVSDHWSQKFFYNCKLFTIDVALGISKVSLDSDFFSFCTTQRIFKSDEKWSDKKMENSLSLMTRGFMK